MMAKTEQEIGEALVQEVFVAPLERLGLARPKGTLVADFAAMKRELCARLWRMDEGGLHELCEWVIQHPEAKANRWPPAALIIEAAKPLLPPPWPPSDRMVAIFNHKIGQAAIAGGWSPELYRRFVGVTAFPNDFAAGLVFEQAGPALARMAALQQRVAAGGVLTEGDRRWFDAREKMLVHCLRVRDHAAQRAALAQGGDA